MADPTTPTTPIPSFNLNLEPSTEKPVTQTAPESVEPEKDDRLQKEDQLVENQTKIEEVAETKTESAPVVEATPIIEIEKIMPETKIEETKPEIIEAPVVETPAPVVQTPAPVVQTPAPVVETSAPVVETSAPVAPSTTLQKDLQIIQNIQQSPTTPAVPVAPKVAPVQIPLTPPANSFNLDNISAQIPVVPQMPGVNTPIGNISTAPNIPLNPYDNLTNYVPQIAPIGQANAAPISTIKKSSKTGTEIGIGVGVGFIVLARFVVKTMYPIQYKDAVGSIFGSDDESISTAITTSLTGSDMTGDNILSGELASGDIAFGSGDMILSGTLDTGTLLGLTGNHGAAEDTGSLIASTSTTSMSMDDFKAKIEAYASQGKIATLKAKKTGDKQLITNSLNMYKKAEATLQDIANGKEITTDDMNKTISEISGYLDNTNPSPDATPSTTEKPINTGSSDFNPDAFF